MESYIHDGYTRSAFIAERPLLYSALRFTFRPLLTIERRKVANEIVKADPDKAERFAAGVIERQVKSWDLRDRGQPVPVQAAHILCLQAELAKRLYEIVMGWDGGDHDPQVSEAEQLDALPVEQLLEAVFGDAPLLTLEEHDQKN